MSSAPVLFAATLAAAALAGCGTGGKEADVREVAGRFLAAAQRDDGAAACALLTSGTRQQLEADEGEPCAQAISSVELPGRSPVRRIAVHVTSASADLEVGGTLFLDETSAGWRVAAAGCAPRPGRQPFECELEA
jgi:hypothetical protein